VAAVLQRGGRCSRVVWHGVARGYEVAACHVAGTMLMWQVRWGDVMWGGKGMQHDVGQGGGMTWGSMGT